MEQPVNQAQQVINLKAVIDSQSKMIDTLNAVIAHLTSKSGGPDIAQVKKHPIHDGDKIQPPWEREGKTKAEWMQARDAPPPSK